MIERDYATAKRVIDASSLNEFSYTNAGTTRKIFFTGASRSHKATWMVPEIFLRLRVLVTRRQSWNHLTARSGTRILD